MLQIIKLSIGGVLAILIASFVGLNNPLTAGVVVLLCLGKTRRSSLESSIIRAKSLAIALVLASVIFVSVGFSVYAFCLFLIIFIPIIMKLNLEVGLIIGVVLAGHLLAWGAIDQMIMVNTVSLFAIGVVVAFVANLYVPKLGHDIVQKQRAVEGLFSDILLQIATMLRGDLNFDESIFLRVENIIDTTITTARIDNDNHLLTDNSYFVDYMQFRQIQLEILKRLASLAQEVGTDLVQAELIAELTTQVANSISEFGSGEKIIVEINRLTEEFRVMPLPLNRNEFENRAILFQFLNEIRYLVELKRFFRAEHPTNR